VRRSQRLITFIAILQSILCLAHFFLYETWTFSPVTGHTVGPFWFRLALLVLSVSFVPASLLAFRYTNVFVRVFYRIAAVWIGLLSFLVIAAICSWPVFGIAQMGGLKIEFHQVVEVLFGLGVISGFYGVVNASLTRVTRTTVRLANLPEAWRGRKAALISDLHLGPVRNGSFLRRIIAKVLDEKPDAVFIAGDLYDGTAIDAASAAKPLKQLTTAPRGVYFVAGNHEQFHDEGEYLQAVKSAGVRVLTNEKLEVDGLQIAGIPYAHATNPRTFTSVLRDLRPAPDRASILLTHAPDYPELAEAAGFSLQLSGHTHLGQFIPWSWIATRIYKQFVYGLSWIGKMQVFTSSGAGTWGPPLRLGSNPEIVVLQFD